jgi:hypothetical protein
MLCGTQSCFANEESFEMIRKAVAYWREQG